MRNSLAAALLGAGAALAQVPGVDWESITPSSDLEWTECLEEFQCARLELPLDWKNESDPRTVAIAMMKKPAVVPVDDPAWGGPIFSNPGGPGHSGVDFIPRYAGRLQSIFDTPGEKHYDIVSFDPRGIGSSTPTVDCLESLLERDAFFIELRGTHGLGMGKKAVSYALSLMEGLGERCQAAYDDGLEIFPYISSASVVRDMVEMIDKSDALRKKEQRKRGLVVRDDEGEARLQFVGFSYGSILANYFASMYPGRVGRIVLDGVVDAQDYSHGPGWLKAGLDTDGVFDQFISTCFDAGENCALWREEYTSGDEIKSQILTMIERLDEQPIGRLAADGKRMVIRGDDFKEAFGVYSYNGITGFRQLAAVFDTALQGDYTFVIALLKSIRAVPTLEDGCPSSNGTVSPLPPPEFLYSVMCLDGSDVRDEGIDYWTDYISDMESVSEFYGATLALVRFGCSHWPFRAKWRFDGPFTTPEHDPDLVEGKPAAPLLFINNRWDPVTPVRNTRTMAENHAGSGIVVQESIGHCALLVATSNCTAKITREYFATGKVPKEEAVCEEECHPWDPECGAAAAESEGATKRGVYGAMPNMLPRLPFNPKY